MSADPQNDWKQGDLQYTILRKILSRLPFISGGGGGGGGGTLSTDPTLGGATPSDILYPSQKAAKTYIDNGLATKQNSLGYTPENVANKATNLTAPDNVKYPTTLAVSTALAGKQDSLGFTPENVANKATNFLTLNNTLYPTTQAVADYIGTVVGDYVLKIGDTMSGPLLIEGIAEGVGPGLKVQKDGSVSDMTVPTDAHIWLDNPTGNQSFIDFTFGGVAAGGVRVGQNNSFAYVANGGNIYFSPAALTGSGFSVTMRSIGGGGSTIGDVLIGDQENSGVALTYDPTPGENYVLALRKADSTPAESGVRAYYVYDSSTSYERLSFQFIGGGPDGQIFSEVGSGGGTLRDIVIGMNGAVSPTEHVRFQASESDNPSPLIGFFGATPVVQQTMGPATAGGLYTATEQNMLQAVYDAVRNLGLGT